MSYRTLKSDVASSLTIVSKFDPPSSTFDASHSRSRATGTVTCRSTVDLDLPGTIIVDLDLDLPGTYLNIHQVVYCSSPTFPQQMVQLYLLATHSRS